MKKKVLLALLVSILIISCEKEKENQPPTCEISSPANGAEFEIGKTIVISAEAEDADGKITEVRFYINDIGVSSSSNFPYTYEWNTINEETGNHIIKAIAKDNDGDSKTDEITISLIIENATVNTTEINSITHNSAASGGNVTDNGGATVTARGICWSTSSNPTTADSKTTDGSGTGSFTSTLTGLSSETTYYVRAYATNSVGTAYGDEKSFTTDILTVTDYDGNTYNTVKIGNQWWMAENLKVNHYPDGTAISLVEGTSAWNALGYTDKAYCYYSNSSANGDTYGALYTWAAAMNGTASSDANPSGVQGVCPDGWHLPSDDEWKELEMFLGMSQSEADDYNWRGTNEGSKLAGNEALWNNGSLDSNAEFGTSDFTALPGGSRYSNGDFSGLGDRANFWSATEPISSLAWYRRLYYNNSDVYRDRIFKDYGFSVRCTKD